MKMLKIPGTDLEVSNVAMGCMRLKQLTPQEVRRQIDTALDAGINFFDHADIYGGGTSEALFAEAIAGAPSLRRRMVLQSKCGIREGYYDFSKAHILEAVDGSLRRLGTDYLDVLLLHRPDALVEPEETADALTTLKKAGKVRYFGVSNHTPLQIELLQRHLGEKLLFNQLQFGLAHTPLIDASIALNMHTEQSVERAAGTLDYCRLNGITIQAWSPFKHGLFGGVFLGDRERCPALNEAVDALAEKYGVSPIAVAVAWITRHPANMQVILGTTKPQRLREGCGGSDLPLTRAEWYGLYRAAGNRVP